MKTIKLKLTRLQSEIFNFLCENVGNETNQSFIAKKLNVSSTAIAKALKDLEKEKLVMSKKEKNLELSKFEEILKRKIIINFYSSPKEIHKELKESLCNGIVLSGGIEL